ncbi:MAG TPA: hypothetical protein DCL81_15760 [Algoriphagus sp.]|jgi:hypothetical protein|nr:hypothetical protein [Algoriphagus sp.]|tara:strand:+ start:246 stop:446 length:201 start_codon:yes stop_codon:yes gene_type:complete
MSISRLILSISKNGEVKVVLAGKGITCQGLLRGYERFVEAHIPKIEQKVKESLRSGRNENTNPYFY